MMPATINELQTAIEKECTQIRNQMICYDDIIKIFESKVKKETLGLITFLLVHP